MPSDELTPETFVCDALISGASPNEVTCLEACGLWQSTHVAWRLLLSTTDSAASCELLVVPAGNGWPIFANSDDTSGAAGERFDPPLWHVVQLWVVASSAGAAGDAGLSSRVDPNALCGMWLEVHAFLATVS